MGIKQKLINYKKKIIEIETLTDFLKVNISNPESVYAALQGLISENVIEPVKSSGKNGNIKYPLYKKYRILAVKEETKDVRSEINRLHPLLLQSGYLSLNPEEYTKNHDLIIGINRFLFSERKDVLISRKERSYALFGKEKMLDDSGAKSLLHKLKITEHDLRFYDTPEYCFHDFIPEKSDNMTLLICENKDIWFNIRRCMFEEGWRQLYGEAIDGVVYGEGNKISQKQGALSEYVKFMGNPKVKFLYWGDIDREGFDIFKRTKDVNANLDFSLFVPGYRQMIKRAKGTELENSSSSKKQGILFDDLFEVFFKEEQEYLKGVLENNKLIPQEIVPFTLLSKEE